MPVSRFFVIKSDNAVTDLMLIIVILILTSMATLISLRIPALICYPRCQYPINVATLLNCSTYVTIAISCLPLLLILCLPAILHWIVFISTGCLHPFIYHFEWLTFAFSLAMLSSATALITPQIKRIVLHRWQQEKTLFQRSYSILVIGQIT